MINTPSPTLPRFAGEEDSNCKQLLRQQIAFQFFQHRFYVGGAVFFLFFRPAVKHGAIVARFCPGGDFCRAQFAQGYAFLLRCFEDLRVVFVHDFAQLGIGFVGGAGNGGFVFFV